MEFEQTVLMQRAADSFDANAMTAAQNQIHSIERARMELRHTEQRFALTVRQAEERLQNMRNLLLYSELLAPFDGIITFVSDVNSGQNLNPEQVLMHLACGERLVVEVVDMTGPDFPNPFSPGALPDPWIPLPVRSAVSILGYSDENTYELQYIPLTEDEYDLRPVRLEVISSPTPSMGDHIIVHFYTQKLENTLRFPVNALFTAGTQNYVYREINGEFVFTPIRIIARTAAYIAVSDGLEVGDALLVRP